MEREGRKRREEKKKIKREECGKGRAKQIEIAK
jgi:hypothetical protein